MDHFSRLPAEIIEYIAEEADPQDLLPLRRTCRYLQQTTRRTFARVHFTEHSLLITEEHLRRAVELVKHPYFSRHITTLRICVDRYSNREATKTSWRLQLAIGAQRSMAATDRDIKLLTKLFNRLKTQNLHSIVLFDGWVASGRPCSHPDGLGVPDCAGTRSTTALFEALRLSQPSITNLSTAFKQCGIPTTHLAPLQLQDLQTLSLQIFSNEDPSEAWAQALTKLPLLEDLSITIAGSNSNDGNQNIGPALMYRTFPSLKSFKVFGALIRLSEMVAFLRRARVRGLKTAKLHDVAFDVDEDVDMEGMSQSEAFGQTLRKLTRVDVSCLNCFDGAED